MKTISVLSQKGGAGKSTIAINLAVAAELVKKSSAIIDLDPQASASNWNDSREQEFPVVVAAQPSRLPMILETAQQSGANFVFIDSAPHSEASALAAARLSDFIIIPCRPAILDIRAIESTIELATIAKTKCAVVLNCTSSRGNLADQAEHAIESFGVRVSPVRITQRAAFVHSITAGLGVGEYEKKGKANAEITELFKWISKQVK